MSKPHIIEPQGYTISEVGAGVGTEEHLRDVDCGRRWVTTTMSGLYVVIDRGASEDCSGLGIFHTPATPTATRLIRSSDTEANLLGSSPPGPFARTIPGAGTDDFIASATDSDVQARIAHWRHRSTVWIDTVSPITERYVRIDITDAALASFYASRLVAGVAHLLPRYPARRAQPPAFEQASIYQEALTSAVIGTRSRRFRTTRFSLDAGEADELLLSTIYERRGSDLDVVFVWDYEHTHAHRYSFLGVMDSPQRPTIPHLADRQIGFSFQETFDPIGS